MAEELLLMGILHFPAGHGYFIQYVAWQCRAIDWERCSDSHAGAPSGTMKAWL
ncbi:MAG TPA: hypothetical protein PLA74_09400 [Syntrophales bacterium]|nr:hypothetical protein [Syntrophales bacterium]HPQ43083.1 hypothetical protein [Syntrophales bacterium]